MKKYCIVYEARTRHPFGGHFKEVRAMQICREKAIEDFNEFMVEFFQEAKIVRPGTAEDPLPSLIILNIIPLPI